MNKKYIFAGLVALLILCGIQIKTSQAGSCLFPQQGGTGLCSASSTNIGQVIGVTGLTSFGAPIYSYVNASSTGGSGSTTNVFGTNGITVTQVGANATTSLNTSTLPTILNSLGYSTSTGGGIATGSVATLGSPLTIGGNASATIYGTASSSYIANFNTKIQFPTPAMIAAGANCISATGVTDAGTCLQDISNSLTSSTEIDFGTGYWSTPNGVTFDTAGVYILLKGVPGGGTVWNFTGTSSSSIGLSFGPGNSNEVGWGYENMSILGPGTGSSTCVFIGGTNNAAGKGFIAKNSIETGCFTNIQQGSNAYLTTLDNNYDIGGVPGGYLLNDNGSSNAGETLVVDDGSLFDGSTDFDTIQLQTSGETNYEFDDCGIDDAPVFINQYGGQGNNVHINQCHDENPGNHAGAYPSYIPITMNSGNPYLNDSVSLTNNTFQNDAPASSTPACVISLYGQLNMTGNGFDNDSTGGTINAAVCLGETSDTVYSSGNTQGSDISGGTNYGPGVNYIYGTTPMYSGVQTYNTTSTFSGNTGFGTVTNPAYTIDATGGTVAASTIRAVTGGQLLVTGLAGLKTGVITSTDAILFSNGGLEFAAGGALTSSVGMYETTGQRIGIGTTTPGTILDVAGNITDESVTSTPCLGTNSLGVIGVGTCSGGGSTTTINGQTATVFRIIGDGQTVTTTVSGATTTFAVIPGTYITPASGTLLYYPLSGNPSGFITTSTFNATGTAFYFPTWNASGTALSASSQIYASGTSIGIGTVNPTYALDVPNGTIEGNVLRATANGKFVLTNAAGIQPGNITSTDELIFANGGLELNAGGATTSTLALFINPTTRDVIIGTSTDNGNTFQVAGNAEFNGNISTNSSYLITGKAAISSPVAGNLELGNANSTDFFMLQFGGTSSTYLGIRVTSSTQTFAFRNANNTADANITAASGTFSGNIVADGTLSVSGVSTLASTTITQATTTNLSITALGSSGNPCLSVNTTGAVATTTCGSGGGGGSGNLFVSPTSSVVANDFPYYTANGSSTVSASSSLFQSSSTNDISIGTTTDLGLIGGVALPSSSNLLVLENSQGVSELTVATSGTLTSGNSITSGGSVTLGATSILQWSGRSREISPVSGNVLFQQGANSDFLGLQFGSSTANGLELTTATNTQTFGFRNGSNTADANITAASGTFSGNVAITGHTGFATSTVSVSSCGTGSPTVLGSDNDGAIVSGSSASSCTLNFATRWNTPPVCTVSDSNTTAVTDVSAITTSSVTFSMASALSAVNIYYQCQGNPS